MQAAIRVAAVATAFLVCAASATSYRNSYKESNLGNGVFMVVVEVNRHTSYATARQYAFQRASEVCGPSGFVVGGADGNSYGPTGAITMGQTSGTATGTYEGTSRRGTVTGTYSGTSTSTTMLVGGGHDFTLLYACNNGYDGSRAVTGHGGASGRGAPGYPPPEDLPRY